METRQAPTVQEVPSDTTIEYIAEGAANVIYRLDAQDASKPTNPAFSGRLLRLRKAIPSGLPNTKSMGLFRDMIAPLLPRGSYVEQELVKLPPSLLVSCNARLRADEQTGKRPKRRHGVYLAEDEPFGLLVTDMTPDQEQGEVLVELKPKWLVQSPTAPPGARRCRTCALRSRRNALRRREAEQGHDLGPEENWPFCPLDLVSADQDRLSRAVTMIVEKTVQHNLHRKQKIQGPSTAGMNDEQELRSYLERGILSYVDDKDRSVLPRLRELQTTLDPVGVFKADISSPDFSRAMTLRDCTLFLKLSPREGSEVEARLGDLDFKLPDEGKKEYWRSLETSLIDEGWYQMTEHERDPDERSALCALSTT
ncbi:MAG: hypothetical protein M4579_000622 [Chaenotheca gracillima]|nr:MAG: hypothetical protein M4579_000622 [Chaenotheca gracillima]